MAQVAENQQDGMSDAMVSRLRAVPILTSVPETEIRCLSDGREMRLAQGEFVARQGETAHFFWILLAGEVRIYQTQPGGGETTIARIPAGTAMGEMQILSNTPYAANAQTTEPCELLQFDEQQFWNMMTSCPSVRKAILGNMAYRFQKFQSIVVQQEKWPRWERSPPA